MRSEGSGDSLGEKVHMFVHYLCGWLSRRLGVICFVFICGFCSILCCLSVCLSRQRIIYVYYGLKSLHIHTLFIIVTSIAAATSEIVNFFLFCDGQVICRQSRGPQVWLSRLFCSLSGMSTLSQCVSML